MRRKTSKLQLIGRIVKVTKSRNKSNIGIEGKIIDETKFTIVLETGKGTTKRLLKSGITMTDKKSKEDIVGESIVGKLEERLKQR